jgi:hypothetical protein
VPIIPGDVATTGAVKFAPAEPVAADEAATGPATLSAPMASAAGTSRFRMDIMSSFLAPQVSADEEAYHLIARTVVALTRAIGATGTPPHSPANSQVVHRVL